MAKSREKVQQLGFWDAQVSSPDHDAIVMWAYENADDIFRRTCPKLFEGKWLKNEVRPTFDQWTSPEQRQALWDDAWKVAATISRPVPSIVSKSIEFVLMSGDPGDRYRRPVGYADVHLSTKAPYLYQSSSGEYHAMTDPGPSLLIEAKSVMPTLGEMMRQVNLYRTAFHGKFVVVSPDDKFAEILAAQNVTFIRYEP